MAKRLRPKSQRQYVAQNDAAIIGAKLKGSKPGRMPGFITPCLASLRDRVPDGDQWIHEVKFDGYRLQLHKNNNDVRVYTRRGHDWTKRFDTLVNAAWFLAPEQLILDGEVVVPTPRGQSDFGALEDDLGSGRSDRFVFYAFDVLFIGSRLLTGCMLEDRKLVLAELLSDQNGAIQCSEYFDGCGDRLFRQACKLELEGLVSKRKDSKYRSGRSIDWTKRTCRQRETFVVAGLAFNKGKFDGIYLGRRENGKLLYAGKVENGFDTKAEETLRKKAEKLKSNVQPLASKIKKPKAVWLKPKLLVDVEYRALTGAGKVRHPSYKGIREDL